MKARKHKELFLESIETMKEFEPIWENIEKYFEYPRSMITFSKSVFDDRKEWNADTYYVIINNSGVYGMVSEEPK